jgi:GNAT superfamily N-acetyltransferase
MTVVREMQLDSPAVRSLLTEWMAELSASVPGFSPSGGSRVQASDFVAPDGVFLVATDRNGTALGCGGLRRLNTRTAEIKRLVVRRSARRRGIGRALLLALEDHARRLGFGEIRLDTMGNEPAAVVLFLSAGYQHIPDYNGNPRARHWFGKGLTRPLGDQPTRPIFFGS